MKAAIKGINKNGSLSRLLTQGALSALFMTAIGCGKPVEPTNSSEEMVGILGGQAVQATDVLAASTVGIVDLKSGQVICTGSLISNNMVMTAGHCTSYDPRTLAILFSNKIPQSQAEVSAAAVRRVVTGRAHPNWARLREGQDKNWGDVAILRFTGGLPKGFRPAKVLSDASALQDGTNVILAGFGVTEGRRDTPTKELLKVDMKIAKAKFSDLEVLFDQRAKRGACRGDSGGPAFVQVKGEWVVFGVTSRAYQDPGVICEGFSVYTKTPAIIGWIRSTVDALAKATRVEMIPQPN